MGENSDGSLTMFDSFAEAISTLEKLSNIESKISAVIEKSHMPWKETRKLLKCVTPMQASNTPLIQFLQDLFVQIGLGKLNVISVSNIQYVFTVSDCEVCKLYPSVQGKKVCFIIADALASFFLKDLTLPCTVEEIKCSKENGTIDEYVCEFRVDLDPLSVYTIALDDIDKDIVRGIAEKTFDILKFNEKYSLEGGEIEYRLDTLSWYNIIDNNGDLTEIGHTYHKYTMSVTSEEEDFDPPWKSMSEITSAISAKSSFAETLNEMLNPEPFIKIKPEETVNLAEEAKKSKSFAELIAKQVKSDQNDEED